MLAKREEVKRLKALKMREFREKLEKVREEGGLGKPKGSQGKGKQNVENADEDYDEEWEDADWGALGELDLEGDWDPEKHDAQMRTLYAEEGEYEVSIGLSSKICAKLEVFQLRTTTKNQSGTTILTSVILPPLHLRQPRGPQPSPERKRRRRESMRMKTWSTEV